MYVPPNSTIQKQLSSDRLDLVEFALKLKPFINFENTVFIGAQHILPSTLLMFQSFFDRGLKANNLFLIGKCYSTDFDTYCAFKNLGSYICHSSLEFDKNVSFDSAYSSNIRSFVNQFLKNSPALENKQIIVLDDGGELITAFHSLIENRNFYFTCLEQTTSGYENLKKLNLQACIINVARADLKLTVESKIVAKTAVEALFDKVSSSAFPFKEILLIGNGAIGSAINEALLKEKKFNISLIDINPNKSKLIYEQCLKNFNSFDLILGCVGKTILPFEKISRLNSPTTLASLSSSDREFDILKLRKKSNDIYSCHDDFEYNGIRILNCGFPINFSGNANKADIKEFELTRALLTLGILQAIEFESKKGIFPLNTKEQSKIFDLFLEKYGFSQDTFIQRKEIKNDGIENRAFVPDKK